MKILVYEFLTAGGWERFGKSPAVCQSLLVEGAAMAAGIAEDFTVAGLETCLIRHPACSIETPSMCDFHDVTCSGGELEALTRLALEADWTLVIAPEFDGILYDRAAAVIAAGGRLLGPNPDLIRLASDKQRTADWLGARGVPVPEGQLLTEGRLPTDFPYPAVIKPNDGAGSQGIALVNAPTEYRCDAAIDKKLRIERFCPGRAASAAVVCGRVAHVALLPCRQHLSRDGRFHYLGGWLPMDRTLESRAIDLATQAVAALPHPFGYIGVDMVLGRMAAEDVVIEVNPRLTTSYVGLRRAAQCNLAQIMLQLAQGEVVEPLNWNRDVLRFRPDGNVEARTRSRV